MVGEGQVHVFTSRGLHCCRIRAPLARKRLDHFDLLAARRQPGGATRPTHHSDASERTEGTSARVMKQSAPKQALLGTVTK